MPLDMTAAFRQVLDATQDEFAKVELYNKWQPPDGQYSVLLTGFANGVSEKGVAWGKMSGSLQAPGNAALDQKEFSPGYYSTEYPISLKQDASALAGRKVDSNVEAFEILAKAADDNVMVLFSVQRGTNKKGKGYVGTQIDEIVPESAGEQVAT